MGGSSLGVGMIELHSFAGAVHSHAWRTVAASSTSG